MRPSLLLLAFAAAVVLTSCTAAYKTGQTPDDVYFSPQKVQAEYVGVKEKDDDPGYYNGNDYYGDRYLRMKVQNRYQWSDLDDYYYTDRYAYGFGGYGGYSYTNSLYGYNPWSPATYWNYYYNPYYSSFYNPYYSPIIILGGNKYGNNFAVTHSPRAFNLNTYNNTNLLNNRNYTNRTFEFNNSPSNNNPRQYNYNNNYRNSRTSAGNYLRNTFRNNDNYNNSNDNSRSFNNNNNNNNSGSSGRSSSGGGSSSGSSGGSAPVRRF